MNLQLASDLHLEVLDRDFPGTRLVEPEPQADVLVLAGDIHVGTRAVTAFRDWPVPVVYLAGNHEFYGLGWEETRADLQRACTDTPIVFLDDAAARIGGVRFLGCTLWTDFRLPGLTREAWMAEVDRDLTDRLIHTRTGPLRARHMLEDHERSRRWLEQELARPFDGPTVVVSHHGPHPRSVHARHAGSPLNAGFVSDLTPLLASADLWLHGHVHDSVEYHQSGCRVVANPAGYVVNRATARRDGFRFENPAFDPRLVLALAPSSPTRPHHRTTAPPHHRADGVHPTVTTRAQRDGDR